VAFALQADGWYLRSDIIWHKPNPMPESVTDRPTKAHEYLFLLTKSERYYYDAEAIAEPLTRPEEADRKTPARFGGADKFEEARKQSRLHSGNEYTGTPNGTRNKRSVWTVATQPYSEAHFATFPPKLIEPCILAGCPSGGLVLDPFAGSGTTLQVAQQLGRRGVGIELNPAYIALAEQRTAQAGLPL
jgi:DNA modification methylase